MKTASFLSCVALAAIAGTAQADMDTDMIEASLLPGWRMANGGHMAALRLTLDPGWKTYWRAPGDAGIPPQFNWSGSRNLSALAVNWPTPDVFDQNGMRSIGYSDQVVLPLQIAPSQMGQPITLKGKITIGVCKDICVPKTLRIKAVLPADVTKPTASIAAAMADTPFTAREAKVTKVSCDISPANGGMAVEARVRVPNAGGTEVVIVETDNPLIWVAEADAKRSGNTIVARTEMHHVDGSAFAINRDGLRITVIGSGHAVDIQGCPAR